MFDYMTKQMAAEGKQEGNNRKFEDICEAKGRNPKHKSKPKPTCAAKSPASK